MSIIFLSIVIMFLLIFFLFMSKSKRPLFSGLLSKYLMLCYCGVLLLSCPAVYVLPPKTLIQTSEDQNQQISQAQDTAARLLDIAKQGKLDRTPGIHKKADFSFQVAVDKLELVPGGNFDYDILIARKDSDDGLVQVSSYMTSTFVQGMDVTQNILPPVVNLEGNRLKLNSPEYYTLNYAAFKPDFTAQQFTGGFMLSVPEPFGNTAFGRNTIYLQIPKNMKIIGNLINVIYLE